MKIMSKSKMQMKGMFDQFDVPWCFNMCSENQPVMPYYFWNSQIQKRSQTLQQYSDTTTDREH